MRRDGFLIQFSCWILRGCHFPYPTASSGQPCGLKSYRDGKQDDTRPFLVPFLREGVSCSLRGMRTSRGTGQEVGEAVPAGRGCGKMTCWAGVMGGSFT